MQAENIESGFGEIKIKKERTLKKERKFFKIAFQKTMSSGLTGLKAYALTKCTFFDIKCIIFTDFL